MASTTESDRRPPEHEHLLQLIEALESLMQCRLEGEARLDAAVVLMTQQLTDDLEAHFEVEERGGYFADVRRSTPHLSPQIDKLFSEHAVLRRGARELAQLTREAREKAGHWTLAEKRLHELTAQLRRHESAENGLVLESYQTDLGGGA